MDAPLIRILFRRRDRGPLLKEEVISHFETSEPEHIKEVEAQLRSMGAAILLPAFIGEELVAFLVLGAKRSREIYTPDDLGMFKILAGQAGLAIENAEFYQELKEAQATILQAAKLSSIGELATGFAHQIDNPLGIISLGCQLCIRDIKEDFVHESLTEKGKKALEAMRDRLDKVIDTAHRAADLVQRIRGYAKPSDRDFEPTDLNSVMEDVLGLAQYQISRGGINVTKDIPQNLPKIRGIGVQLEQVFLNMTINACEAMVGKKGELTISARVEKDNPHTVEVTLSDNGCGIPKENLNKLFDIFFTTKGSQGTGVGLSMAYRIVKDHSGDIDVESEVGKGSKFTVSLPIWEEKV
jgi:two-component system NtrC family sensor kinase